MAARTYEPIYVESDHNFYFGIKEAITPAMVADSMLGLDAVIKKSAQVLAKMLDIRVKDSDVFISSIGIGSLDENLLVRFFLGKGKVADANLEKLREFLGLKKMTPKKLIGWIIAGVILYGSYQWYLGAPAKPEATYHFENSFNNLGKEAGIKPEEVLALLQSAVRNPEDLKKQIVKLTHPAGTTEPTSLSVDRESSFTLPQEITASVPPTYDRAPEDEPFKSFDNIQIVIRAVDLDRPGQGWAAIVPDVSDKRLPVQLEDGVDPLKVPVGKYTTADITVIYKVDGKGNKTPKKYLLKKLPDPVQIAPKVAN